MPGPIPKLPLERLSEAELHIVELMRINISSGARELMRARRLTREYGDVFNDGWNWAIVYFERAAGRANELESTTSDEVVRESARMQVERMQELNSKIANEKVANITKDLRERKGEPNVVDVPLGSGKYL